ncbi:MAG: hypothetical protein ACOX4H_04225 [Bacillota bacterium]|nr:hypothetical protein [Clostridia bacterium]
MFPLTHALVAQNLVKNDRSRAIIGGVFPDLANVIGLHRDVTHEMGHDFYRFCQENDKDFLDFAQAVISHGANPPGLDYYADQSYQEKEPGYCFQRAVPLVDQVIKTCAIPPQMGLWKAHNFIEMAFDVISVELYPVLPDQFEAALKDEGLLKSCSDLLGRYFHIDGGKVNDAFQKMPKYFCLRDVTPVNLAKKYAVQLKKRHGVLGADPQGIAEVIQEARKIVEEEFSSFLHDAVEKMSRLLLSYPTIKQD